MRGLISGVVGMLLAFILVPICWLIFKFGSFLFVVVSVGILIGAVIYEALEKTKPSK